jgi:hypothetical protein
VPRDPDFDASTGVHKSLVEALEKMGFTVYLDIK